MKKAHLQKALVLVGVLTSFFVVAHVNEQLRSASLTSVSVTMSNPRPSFRGALTSGNTVGSSTVIINTTAGSYPSTSSAQLVEGDVVRIGSAGTMGTHTVASTSSLSTFTVTSALGSGNADSGDDVISTQSATHTVRFTTANAIANGRFRVLVPALTDNGASSDGIPDGGFFDFSTTPATMTCPSDVGSTYDFVSGVASASSVTVNNVDYHVFECAYSGTGGVGTIFDGGGGNQGVFTLAGLINPAPKTAHTTGTADAHNIIVQHLDSSFNAIDQTTVQVGVIEAVKLTASVPPQITFQIIGTATGTSACGQTTDVATTPASVPFGEISISAFTEAAHSLTVSTNATGGYSVTAIANDQMGRNGGVCTGDNTGVNCIRDTIGNGGTITHTTSGEWTNVSAKGLGYSLHDVNSSITNLPAEAFSYNESSRTFSTKQFADAEDGQAAQAIFGSGTVADNENLYVCYRIVAASTTAAGNYENYVTYNATSTF
ncbi:MAG TPA: hypothetical protein VD999_02015 [Vitreimonas sp.]|nr:hypothetical protein [Vitreimonas sp.]